MHTCAKPRIRIRPPTKRPHLMLRGTRVVCGIWHSGMVFASARWARLWRGYAFQSAYNRKQQCSGTEMFARVIAHITCSKKPAAHKICSRFVGGRVGVCVCYCRGGPSTQLRECTPKNKRTPQCCAVHHCCVCVCV